MWRRWRSRGEGCGAGGGGGCALTYHRMAVPMLPLARSRRLYMAVGTPALGVGLVVLVGGGEGAVQGVEEGFTRLLRCHVAKREARARETRREDRSEQGVGMRGDHAWGDMGRSVWRSGQIAHGDLGRLRTVASCISPIANFALRLYSASLTASAVACFGRGSAVACFGAIACFGRGGSALGAAPELAELGASAACNSEAGSSTIIAHT